MSLPVREEILDGLRGVANDHIAFAVAWHVIAALVFLAIAVGWRPSNRVTGAALAAPLASVSGFAWMTGNPFNSLVLGALALTLLVLSLLLGDRGTVSRSQWWWQLLGIGMLIFAWCYPHFLVDRSPFAYLVASPLGLIPCPTLAALIGVALVGRGLGNRPWSFTLSGVATFYALFGVLRLGVWLDLALLGGATGLLASTLSDRRRRG